MKTNTEKIMGLLKSLEPKNHVLALELVQSLNLQKEVANLLNNSPVFHFLKGDLDEIKQGFFCYEGGFDNEDILHVLHTTEQIMGKLGTSQKLSRKIFCLTLEITQHLAKNNNCKAQVLFEHKNNSLWLGFCWMVGRQQARLLNEHMQLIDDKLSKEPGLLVMVDRFIVPQVSDEAEESEAFWEDIARRLKGQNYWYHFEALPTKEHRFSLLIEFLEK